MKKKNPDRVFSKKHPNEASFCFHVTRKSRDKYAFEDILFSIKGRVIFANFSAVKILAEKINAIRDSKKNPDKAVSPSLINAMGLLHEIFHYVIESYRKKQKPQLLQELNNGLHNDFGKTFEELLKAFIEYFPNTQVYSGKQTVDVYLKSKTDDFDNSELLIEELIVQWIQNQNPAYKTVKEIIDDAGLNKIKIYTQTIDHIKKYFDKNPKVASTGLSLIDMLLKPSQLYPHSVYDQIKYMYENWGDELKPFLSRLLMSLDFFKEEAKRFIPDLFGKDTDIPTFHGDYHFEPEAFSQDEHWMPRLVLIAKSTYVWLDQLSRQYKREIRKLHQIPDEELNRLANFGFTGLWLIGLWERSTASRKIKQINGNPEAVASAYSLKNYDIAQDIGGYQSYQNLKDRAWQRGIRLASDMVPNHMAIDSDWVRNHPHWFIQSDHPPFPNHSFNGPDLSDQDNMHIFIEDGYWSKSDAAVAFKRVDRHTGHTVYIYHGNDGTGMPWNDTAQLNYMMKEVREAVINTILHVASMFPIIRFDAAMTLAKKHYQRLWFPEPGHGGDIPSRAQYAMSKQEFDKYFPEEFWREVVDRVKQESPDTLLLAEAFWMMEGYFVRSLGMHRVYNSAFMNLLKNEDNAHYRELIRNVLEFNPQILKRYVNFMNNPDEETAIAQFGKDDKYFGVCVMMCTMPGLPMFGHGQIEGFHEKYGMEYKKAYWDESVDEKLVNRHRHDIFPLLKKRKLFSDVDNFFLFNFYVGDGVNENVFCYSNMYENERALVLYNNVYQSTAGLIRDSVGYNDGFGNIVSKSFTDALNIKVQQNHFTIFRDGINNTEYLRNNMDLAHNGLYAELKGYNYQVYSSVREVYADNLNPYDRLHERLGGRGVPSVEESLHELKIEPVIHALKDIFDHERTELLLKGKATREQITLYENARQEILDFTNVLVHRKKPRIIIKNLPSVDQVAGKMAKIKCSKAEQTYINSLITKKNLGDRQRFYLCLQLSLFVLDSLEDEDKHIYYSNWLFEKIISRSNIIAPDETVFLRLFSNYREVISLLNKHSAAEYADIFQIPDIKSFLRINFYEGVHYLNKECWEKLLDYLFVVQFLDMLIKKGDPQSAVSAMIKRIKKLKKSAEKAGYDLTKLIKDIAV